MHMHQKKCRREHAKTPADPRPVVDQLAGPTELAAKTERTEIILFTEPKPGQPAQTQKESGLSQFLGSLADFIKTHPDEMMPILTTGLASLTAAFFPNGLPGQQPAQPQTPEAEDKRSWAEKGRW